MIDVDKTSVDKPSDAPSETTSLTVDSSAVSASSETSRRGRRNRRDRHKNNTKTTTSDSGSQQMHVDNASNDYVLTPTVNLVDLQSSGRNKSSVISSTSGFTVTSKDMCKGSSIVDAVKLASLPLPSSSITGNAPCCVSVLSDHNNCTVLGIDDVGLHLD